VAQLREAAAACVSDMQAAFAAAVQDQQARSDAVGAALGSYLRQKSADLAAVQVSVLPRCSARRTLPTCQK
jgi:hypothetical protein